MDTVTQNQQTVLSLVNKANLVYTFLSMFISFLYIFGATTCPSSREINLSMRHLVLVTLKQVDSLKLHST